MSERVPACLQRGFQAARSYAQRTAGNGDYRGLLLLFGTPEAFYPVISRRLNGALTAKYKPYNPLLQNDDKVYALFDEMSCRDGGIAFDYDGNLIGTEVVVKGASDEGLEHVMEEVMRRKRHGADRTASTRHQAAAYASAQGIPAIAVSEEAGTVMTFQDGRLIEELFFDPRPPVELPEIPDNIHDIVDVPLLACGPAVGQRTI